MAYSMIDYIKLNYDKSFKELEFNELDAAILSTISYFKFENLSKIFIPLKLSIIPEKRITIGAEKTLDFVNEEISDIIKYFKKGKRYRKIWIMDFSYKTSVLEECQFAAITFRITKRFLFTAFRGTDNSLVGWKENLNMSYKTVPSQQFALEYLQRIMKRFRWSKFSIGGHSKGGNLAFYSGMNLKNHQLKRINKIYNFDGPGFINYNLYSTEDYPIFKRKSIKFIPQESLIGILLNHDPYKIVKSSGKYLKQHSMSRWEVDLKTNKFINEIERTPFSNIYEDAFNEWFDTIEPTSRKITVDTLFLLINERLDSTLSNLEITLGSAIKRIIFMPGIAKKDKTIVRGNIISLLKIVMKYRKKYKELTKNKEDKK